MTTREKPLVLTSLDRERPATRGSDAPSSPARPKRGKAKRANTARINQIAVSAAPKAAYTVAVGSTAAAPAPAEHAPLQRSQTAPTGLKRQRSSARAKLEPLPPRVEATAAPVNHQDSHGEEDEAKTPMKSQKRLYGEMIEVADVEALCDRLGLTPKDVWRLRKEFNDEDTDNTNAITLSSFYYLIHEEQRALTTSLLRLAGLPPKPKPTRLTFDEYVRCVVTFATFSEPELLQFFFQVYCDNAFGGSSTARTMVESDLVQLGKDLALLRTAFAGNVHIATGNAVTVANQGLAAEGSLTFADFERFSRQHMVAFYPLLQIQRNVRHAGDLGEVFWVRKTREKLLVQNLVAYMKTHHGFQPPLPLLHRIMSLVLQRPTMQTRVRDLAKRLYAGE